MSTFIKAGTYWHGEDEHGFVFTRFTWWQMLLLLVWQATVAQVCCKTRLAYRLLHPEWMMGLGTRHRASTDVETLEAFDAFEWEVTS